MSDTAFDKNDWVGLLREVGLDEEQMHRWHAAFERRHPEAHQSFLEWLGVPGPDIERIRASSRGDWA